MSKFDPLWHYVKENTSDTLTLTFDDIEKIAGVPIDHSFLRYKKELEEYGCEVSKISMKNKTVVFKTVNEPAR